MTVQDVRSYMTALGIAARAAARETARAPTARKNAALAATADAIRAARAGILAANAKDVAAARAADRPGGPLDEAMIDRLTLSDDRVDAMLEGLAQVAALPDPIGEITDLRYRPTGIQVGKMRVPLGVVGMIYESRPNVTIEAASLCLKSGNATILRGGSESIHSNRVLAACIRAGLKQAGLPEQSVQVVDTTDRAAVGLLVAMPEYVDVIIPRGGKRLIERVSAEAKVPVIKHLDGNCHVYIDAKADPDKAERIAFNAKTHRYGVCNAMETLLVHTDVAAAVLPRLKKLYDTKQVELRGCERTRAILTSAVNGSSVKTASEQDWHEEYLAAILAVKVVDSADAAIAHINQYGSHHTDAIVTEDYTLARRFLTEVDSSSVMVNASTRFADGFEYGLGAEIGISTDKFHARGPVGLEGLTSQKWVVLGDGHVRG